MFNNYDKKIKSLEKNIQSMTKNIEWLWERIEELSKESKKSYMWTLREDEIDLMKCGEKYKNLRKILE